MKYLVDANVWLQAIVRLSHAAEVVDLLNKTPAGLLAITDFSLHSIAMRLTRSRPDQFVDFLDDIIQRRVNTLHLAAAHLRSVVAAMQAHHLDFDDAMQYFTAEHYDLKLVSFDTDFDRTPRGRMTPAQALAEMSGHSA